jgi:D-glycero-D-manno-heptose 1,7-bisphosphate phosphatase
VNHSSADQVVILDRDGTIVVDRNYLSDPAGLELLPGAAEGLRSLHEQGYRLVVITNQSGVGRGLFSLERLAAMNRRLKEMVQETGGLLERIYFCPHRPEDQCLCRKPRPKLLLDAASELGFTPRKAIVIGDKASDVAFGRNVGATTMLIGSTGEADYLVRDLAQAASILKTLPER